jgi:ABC-type uncharacterized transport system involved in gliding motility auxiliary subunit
MSGKGVVFLVDGMAMQAPGGMGGQMQQMNIKMGQANDTGLGKILEAYGFKIGQDFVFDRQNVPGPVEIGSQRGLANVPMFVAGEVKPAKDTILFSGIRGMVVFPYPSSVELAGPLAGGKTPAGGKLWKVANSSKESWKHTGFLVISGDSLRNLLKEAEEKKPADLASHALGYAYQGPLKSAFAPAQAAPVSDPNAPASETKRPVRLVVVGDSDFASDEYVQLARALPFYGSGAQLLYNAISWTVEDEALAPLRSKTVTPRPVTVSDSAKEWIRYGNVAGLPLAFCLYGVVRWRIRRATRLSQKL